MSAGDWIGFIVSAAAIVAVVGGVIAGIVMECTNGHQQ